MPIWENMGRVVVYRAGDIPASNAAEYLIKQGISAVIYHDADSPKFAVTVPACDEGRAKSLLASRGKSSLASYIQNLRHAPKRARTSHIEGDNTITSLIFLICGGIVFIISLAEFIVALSRGDSPLFISIIELVLGSFFIGFGLWQMIRTKKRERELQREAAFTESVVRFITSTYTGNDIDSIILRGAAFDDLESSRREIIHKFIVREFDVPDEAYIIYLTSQSYKAIYELQSLK